jgi:hypothetical protein
MLTQTFIIHFSREIYIHKQYYIVRKVTFQMQMFFVLLSFLKKDRYIKKVISF